MALGRGVVPRRVSEHSRGCLWGLRLDLGATAETPVTVLFWREELVAEIMQVWGTSLEVVMRQGYISSIDLYNFYAIFFSFAAY